ncbi:TIGR02281 family clan AA aspartic protease [Candidatus Omnitrophota bacterium]
MRVWIAALIFFFLIGFISEVNADTVYLKNGRRIEGLIEKEDEEDLELNVGFGTVKFRMSEIKSIYRSSRSEVTIMHKEWQKERRLEKQRRSKREKELEEARKRRELEPREVGFSQASEHIVVNTLLNKKVRASLLLDTGSTAVLLSSRIASELGLDGNEIIEAQMADGRKINARYVVLDSVSVGGVEANDVGAVILPGDSETDAHDGLLGMSFLNKFNFQIDTVNKKLILQKRKID